MKLIKSNLNLITNKSTNKLNNYIKLNFKKQTYKNNNTATNSLLQTDNLLKYYCL